MNNDLGVNVNFDRTFPCNYLFEVLPAPILIFGGEARLNLTLAIKVASHSESWTSVFADGLSLQGRIGAFTCPNADEVCVLSGSTAYIFNTTRSRDHAPVVFEMIVDALPLRWVNILVLVSFDSAIGVGSTGVRWRTGRLCDDELKIVQKDGDSVTARGLKNGEDIELILDPSTGSVLPFE
jgi:hypothetical protein